MTMNLFHQRSLFLHNQATKKMNMKMAKSIGGTLLRIWNLAWVEINLDYLVYIDHLKNYLKYLNIRDSPRVNPIKDEAEYLAKGALKPGEDPYQANKFNLAASDKVKPDRPVPDTRNRQCKEVSLSYYTYKVEIPSVRLTEPMSQP